MSLTIALAVLGSCLLLAFLLFVLPTLVNLCRLAWWTFYSLRAKTNFEPVVSCPQDPWPDPLDNQGVVETLQSQKVIWAFWVQGGDNIPGFCQLAVQSWRLRNPDWQIIIVSEENYREFVPHEDIPTTFNSLKVQARSDIIRASVLRRYGGVYMDISYVLFKGLDDIWDSAKEKGEIYLTGVWTIKSKGQKYVIPNLCLMIAPTPENPLMVAWQKRLLAYFEDPKYTISEMKKHPLLHNVAPFLDHKALGNFKFLSPYMGSLWCMMETMYYDENVRHYVQHHAYILPTLLWTVDLNMAPLLTMEEKQALSWAHKRENLVGMLRRVPNLLTMLFGDDIKAAKHFASVACATKVSTDLYRYDFNQPIEFHTSVKSTQGRLWTIALDDKVPTVQATAKGAFKITPASPLSFEIALGSVDHDPKPMVSISSFEEDIEQGESSASETTASSSATSEGPN